jgi:hypothetical protein
MGFKKVSDDTGSIERGLRPKRWKTTSIQAEQETYERSGPAMHSAGE